MEAKIQKSFDDQFAALETLKQNASPAELEFYMSAETELRDAYEQMSVPATAPTTESLQAKYKRTFEHISYLEFEKTSPALGEHWNRWAQAEIEFFQNRLNQIIHQLQELGSDTLDIAVNPMTQQKYNDFLVTEANDIHLEEVKMLLGLKLARLQRQGLTEKQISEKVDIQSLRSEIANLEQT